MVPFYHIKSADRLHYTHMPWTINEFEGLCILYFFCFCSMSPSLKYIGERCKMFLKVATILPLYDSVNILSMFFSPSNVELVQSSLHYLPSHHHQQSTIHITNSPIVPQHLTQFIVQVKNDVRISLFLFDPLSQCHIIIYRLHHQIMKLETKNSKLQEHRCCK